MPLPMEDRSPHLRKKIIPNRRENIQCAKCGEWALTVKENESHQEICDRICRKCPQRPIFTSVTRYRAHFATHHITKKEREPRVEKNCLNEALGELVLEDVSDGNLELEELESISSEEGSELRRAARSSALTPAP